MPKSYICFTLDIGIEGGKNMSNRRIKSPTLIAGVLVRLKLDILLQTQLIDWRSCRREARALGRVKSPRIIFNAAAASIHTCVMYSTGELRSLGLDREVKGRCSLLSHWSMRFCVAILVVVSVRCLSRL